MGTLLGITALIFAMYIGISVKRYRKFIKLRFELFKLRDEVLWLAIDGHITTEEAVKLYNTINWPVRYVREFPVFFLFGLVVAYKEMNLPETREELQKTLETMNPKLKDWYFRWNDLTLESIKTYTPIEILNRGPKTEGYVNFAGFIMAFWLLWKVFRLRDHALVKSIFGSLGLRKELPEAFSRAREEAQELSRTRNTAGHIKGLRMGMAT